MVIISFRGLKQSGLPRPETSSGPLIIIHKILDFVNNQICLVSIWLFIYITKSLSARPPERRITARRYNQPNRYC